MSLPELVRAADADGVDTSVPHMWRADVEVDLETGNVRSLKYAACHGTAERFPFVGMRITTGESEVPRAQPPTSPSTATPLQNLDRRSS